MMEPKLPVLFTDTGRSAIVDSPLPPRGARRPGLASRRNRSIRQENGSRLRGSRRLARGGRAATEQSNPREVLDARRQRVVGEGLSRHAHRSRDNRSA